MQRFRSIHIPKGTQFEYLITYVQSDFKTFLSDRKRFRGLIYVYIKECR